MCAYNSNIPQANQRLKDSQSDLLGNFQSISTVFNVNHVDFNVGIDAGKHKWLSFPTQAVAPATLNTEVALFSQTSTLTSNIELAFRQQNNGTIYEFTSKLAAQPGWARLPSGILLKWGNALANGNTAIVFPVAANTPVFAAGAPFTIFLTNTGVAATDLNQAIRLSSVPTANNLGFSVYAGERTNLNTPTNVSFNWLAIGI